MTSQSTFDCIGGVFNTELHDPVFEPSPEFNFEDETGHMISEACHAQEGFGLYDANMQTSFSGRPSLQQQVPDPTSQGYWQDSFQQDISAGNAVSPSTQDEIVNNRSDSVAQFFGQVTPPDTDSTGNQASRTQQAQESDAAKRKERARNAANKRHAKSKKARTASESVGGEEEATEERGERQAHYREKNRVAAAKCRAKKKKHNDHLEEIHRGEASKNRILKAELMGLRNELAQLKGLTLEHSPDNCQCHGIHEYSTRQACLIARGAAPQYGPAISSPSQDSADTPASETTGDSMVSTREQMSPAMVAMSRRTSNVALANWMQPS